MSEEELYEEMKRIQNFGFNEYDFDKDCELFTNFLNSYTKTSDNLNFLINKFLTCDLLIKNWSKEDKEKFEEIKESYLYDN